MRINKIIERKDIALYLERRGLLKQYKKAKNFILLGNFWSVDFKKREPKKDQVRYFRINKQFRALAYLDGETLVVFDIDSH
ncbi:hypothetical protein KKD19_04730 [Patescibacteria group bacterium]|nr:hypothetical protein [Patescibacteria group bacterium]MBU4512514.1 hypothetical protein [Patescibacteria group bacterium]MCG2693507.1 hypothetical protein [Candidatus Parcubacteria bacterium]